MILSDQHIDTIQGNSVTHIIQVIEQNGPDGMFIQIGKRDTIHTIGNSAHTKMMRPEAVQKRVSLRLLAIAYSPLTCDRSVLNSLTKMNAITTTVKNSSTEMADPTPRLSRVTFCL